MVDWWQDIFTMTNTIILKITIYNVLHGLEIYEM